MRFFAFVVAILLICTGFVMRNQEREDHPSKGEQLVGVVLEKTAQIIKRKLEIQPCGTGAAMPGGLIRELTLCFDTKYPYTKEQLRELLIKSAQELLKQVAENNEIQRFLKEQPFIIKNIEIIIYNHDKNGRGLSDPEISTARISQGTLIYRTIDPQDSFKFKNKYQESYEEALKILSTQ